MAKYHRTILISLDNTYEKGPTRQIIAVIVIKKTSPTFKSMRNFFVEEYIYIFFINKFTIIQGVS